MASEGSSTSSTPQGAAAESAPDRAAAQSPPGTAPPGGKGAATGSGGAAVPPSKGWGLSSWGAAPFFWLNLFYVLVLAVLLIGRRAHWLWVDHIPNPVGGLIPIGVPWFGALGAVTISLYGVFDHNRRHADGSSEWDPKWNYWHAARPVVGAVFATVAFLIFIGLINATGTNPLTPARPTASDNVPYLVVGFIVGFREQTFRTLLQRAVDIILGPGIPGQTPLSVSLSAQPPTLASGTAQLTVDVVVANAATAAVNTTIATATVDPSDAATASLTGLTDQVIPPSSHVLGKLVVKPLLDKAYSVQVQVSGSFGTRTLRVPRE